MFASLQSLGSSPVSIDCCKIVCRIGARCVAHSFNIRFGMLSGPDALLMLILCSSFSRPFTVILIGVMLFCALSRVDGNLLFVGLVKTDLNWSSNISAFPLLSLTSCVPFLSGAMPPESCRFDFTYFQKGFGLLFSSPSIMLVFTYSHSAFLNCRLHSFWYAL